MNRRVLITLMLTLAAGLATQSAQAAPLLPTDDGFGYQFLGDSPLNNGPPFSNFLPAGDTTTGHDTKSALKFDVASLGLTSGDVTSASLDLFVVDSTTTGFGVSPSPANPITVNLFALGPGFWNEAALTWNNMPATSGTAYDSLVIDGINQTVSFDMTQLVKDWLDGSVPNNGLALIANSPVGSSPNWVYAVFSSAEGGTSPELKRGARAGQRGLGPGRRPGAHLAGPPPDCPS